MQKTQTFDKKYFENTKNAKIQTFDKKYFENRKNAKNTDF